MHSHHQGMGLGHHLLGRLSAHFARHAIGRHHRGGRAAFWSGFGDPGDPGGGSDDFDNGGWRRGRKFSADDLQLLLLSLLEEQPSHGYELIKALESRTNGFYKPSPGVIYPALTYLEELGYATVDTEGNKKRYHLAPPGRAHLEANRERLALMVGKLRHVARKMDWMRRAMAGEPQSEPEAGGWLPEYVEARQGLKRALLLRTEMSAEEQRRIAAILQRATAEIEAGGQA